jgi:hypothetical protein
MEKSCLLLTQCTKNHEFAIEKKPLISMGLIQRFPLVKLREKEKTVITRTQYHCEE